jgi:hypothetical protein
MCSATQEGLRSRRSKEDTSALRVARSATGPGKPYWKRPVGSTGGIISLADMGSVDGTEAGTLVVDFGAADVADVADATVCSFFSDLVEYMAAVTPAPVAALTAAIIASVVLDIVAAFPGNRRVFIAPVGMSGYSRSEDA